MLYNQLLFYRNKQIFHFILKNDGFVFSREYLGLVNIVYLGTISCITPLSHILTNIS